MPPRKVNLRLPFLFRTSFRRGKDFDFDFLGSHVPFGTVKDKVSRSLISLVMHVYWYGDPRFFHERVTFIFRWCKGVAVVFFFSKILPREKMTATLQSTGLQTVSGKSFRSSYQWGSAELNHITRPGSDNQLFMSRTQ